MTATTGLLRSPRLDQGDAQQHRDQDNLQHRALGEGVHDCRRDDVHEEADEAGLGLCPLRVAGDGAGIDMRGVDVHADAGLHHIHDDEADDERDGREDLEVDDSPHADPTDLLEVAHLGDANDDGAEDHRREQHLDQLDEPLSQWLQGDADIRQKIPDQTT